MVWKKQKEKEAELAYKAAQAEKKRQLMEEHHK